MTFWKTPSFKALQQAWYERLEEEGFDDKEEMIAGEMVLKQSAAHPYKGADELLINAKEEYYRTLSIAVETGEFRNEIDRMILIKYAEGEKIKCIREELLKRGEKRCRNTITFTIRRYEVRWGLRTWTAKQLNRKESA